MAAPYIPDPQDPTRPTTADLAGNMAYELQALKGYIQSLVASGTNFMYIGGFRNRLRNGSFNIAQRGNSVTIAAGTSGYTLDQWIVSSTGSATVVTKQSGGYSVNSSFLQLAVASGNSALSLIQRIESKDVQDMVAGTQVTVSGMYFVENLAAGTPTISLLTPTAIDNWAAATVVGIATPVVIVPQIANTWQFFSLQFILSGDASGGLGLQISYPAGIASQTVSFARLQLEKGAQYTQFEWRPVQVELADCQRYYYSFAGDIQLIGFAGGGAITAYAYLRFPVTMRITPTPGNPTWLSGTNNASQSVGPVDPDGTNLVVNAAAAGGFSVLLAALAVSAEL